MQKITALLGAHLFSPTKLFFDERLAK